MRTYRDAKLMAKSLRSIRGARQVEISHSEGLEIVAKQLGFDNWNILAAQISDDVTKVEGPAQFQQATPILRIFSVPKATEFYCDFLAFSVDWSNDEQGPVYIQVSGNGLSLHLSEQHGDSSPGAMAFVPITNIEAYHAELAGKA